MKVSKDIVKDEWDLPFGGTDEVVVVQNEECGGSRWANIYELVIKKDDKFWQTDYRLGTGDEGERPWEYIDEVEFEEVEPYEVTVVKYRKNK